MLRVKLRKVVVVVHQDSKRALKHCFYNLRFENIGKKDYLFLQVKLKISSII